MKYLVILPLFLLLICGVLCADTIFLKEGQEIKGVIVEDYHDRVVFSTEKGEVCLLKSNIEKIGYDVLEENLVKLGAFYKDKGDYKLALHYYEGAYKLNPHMKEAQEGILLVTNMMFRKSESDLEKEVALRQDTEEKMGRPITSEAIEAGPSQTEIAEAKELWEGVGIAIENVGPDIKVSRVLKNSPAAEAGIEEGDIIVSVWGRLIKYMQIEDVYDLFLRSKVSEFKVMVSRQKAVVLRRNHIFRGAEYMLGARLVVEFEGLTAGEVEAGSPFDNAGILKKDRITRIADASTMYMPLETAYKLIEEMKDNLLYLEIQREIGFWKR